MVYGYIRVSTEKQNTESQMYEINRYCRRNDMQVNRWFDETVSGSVPEKLRKLGVLLKLVKKGDVIICTEVSRLARSIVGIVKVIKVCVDKGVSLYTLKENYIFNDTPTSKYLLLTYGYIGEIEKNLIRERTKEGLDTRRRHGVILGRRQGSKNKLLKLDRKWENVLKLLNNNTPLLRAARSLRVDVTTLYSYIDKRLICEDGVYSLKNETLKKIVPLVEAERAEGKRLKEIMQKYTAACKQENVPVEPLSF